MGQRSASETVTKILFAFLQRRTWSQSELGRSVGVSSRVIRDHLYSLSDAGLPVEREEDHPHVYWSVPRTWFPGGNVLQSESVAQLARLIARHPKSDEREALLSTLLKSVPSGVYSSAAPLSVREEVLSVLEDAAKGLVSVRANYTNVSRAETSWRYISIHRIQYGATIRLVATCHRDQRIKWFRADQIADVVLDSDEDFIAAKNVDIDGFIEQSLNGFRGGDATEYTFDIRLPEGRWALRSLPRNATVTHKENVARITLVTGGLDPLARHLVGLGGLVRAETEALRKRIAELAQDALSMNADPHVDRGSVRAKRSTV